MSDSHTFLGRGWAFPPQFVERTGAAHMAAAEEDIRQSLIILFGTTPGERVMQPSYGCGLKHMVFEVMDQNSITTMKDMIERAVRFFEPRILLHEVSVDDSRWFDGVLLLGLDYTIRATNTRTNLVYPLYLLEGTGVGHRA